MSTEIRLPPLGGKPGVCVIIVPLLLPKKVPSPPPPGLSRGCSDLTRTPPALPKRRPRPTSCPVMPPRPQIDGKIHSFDYQAIVKTLKKHCRVAQNRYFHEIQS